MKISESWLREWVDPDLTTEELAEQITMVGLEVDSIEPVAPGFKGVIIGEIVSVEAHPDADKLQVCHVEGSGSECLQVVCGAPNVKAGIKIPFATVGAVLPGNLSIQQASLRGVESFGMLCSQAELKLGDDDNGLWELAEDAPVGESLANYLQLDDNCIEIDLTPNRSDCLSVRGLARDVGVVNKLSVCEPNIEPVTATINDQLSITLSAPEACPKYAGRIIRGVDLSQSTPLWMRERLRRAGISSKDIAVDTTNYVLLELGQPMHAFDLSALEGGIEVRLAKKGELLALLDGQTVELSEDTLVIADKAKVLAMAGIMGGSGTAVSTGTRDLLLESAFFVPAAIAGRARRYGLHTDSSHRFERGVDHQLQEIALERATKLITEFAGGQIGPIFFAKAEHPILAERKVSLRRDRIVKGLGFAIPDEEVLDILNRLGLAFEDQTPKGWTFKIPSYRFDIAIEEDLLEELARIYGYNRLPTTSIQMAMDLPVHRETKIGLAAIKSHLAVRDYQEVLCYSFVDPEIQRLLDPETDPISLKNPISNDMSVMRTSLWQGLVTVLLHNIHRQQPRVRLFETGLNFLSTDDSTQDVDVSGIKQRPMVAGLIYGHRHTESWSTKAEPVDFYDIKGDVEFLLTITKSPSFSFAAAKHPALHPGQTASISLDGETVGILGALHPQVQQALSLPQTAFVFEISQTALAEAKLPSFKSLSRFPEVRRDIAVMVDDHLAVSSLVAKVKKEAGELLKNLKVFDVYTGKGVDSHRKSVALGLTFQHLSRTLTDVEIVAEIEKISAVLKRDFNAELR